MTDIVAVDGEALHDPARVGLAREHLPAVDETDRLAEWFRILGDPTRTRILYALLEAGELCVGDLAAVVGASETSVSHALRWLRTARIVTSRRGGRMVFYCLDDDHVRQLLALGRAHLRHAGAS